MADVTPGKQQIKALLKMDKTKPVFMLNLIKYKTKTDDGKSGKVAYMRYMKAMEPLLEKAGAQVHFMSEVGANLVSNNEWDLAFIVRYPSPQNFLKMVMSEEYAEVGPMREKALEDAGLIALDQLDQMDLPES